MEDSTNMMAPSTQVSSNGTRGDVAAIDLGSNSFHLLLAQEEGGDVRVVDRIKVRVALAEGLTEEAGITPEARARALDCLARFGQRLKGFDPVRVSAVGTNTFRAARDGGQFLEEASLALGFPIEIVSGAEEARLIYAGVRFASGFYKRRILCVDIGGGSTEFAVGKSERVDVAESLRMGCVTWSERYFPGGKVDEKRFEHAVRAARLVLRSVASSLRAEAVDLYVGSSGTALSIVAVIEAMGWEPVADVAETAGHFSRGGLMRLRDALIEAGSTTSLSLEGLSDTRAPVLADGLAIMVAVFDALRIERMVVSDGALREGLLANLVGQLHHADPRHATVQAMAERFSVDEQQAARVTKTALLLFEAVRRPWNLGKKRDGTMLGWGAQLHELGLSVNHDGYRTHGSYLVANADMAGFTRNEQERLAVLVLSHRGRLRPEVFVHFRTELREGLVAVTMLLRIARILHRSRSTRPLPEWNPVASDVDGVRVLELGIPSDWCEEHPLTFVDLAEEAERWPRLGFELRMG